MENKVDFSNNVFVHTISQIQKFTLQWPKPEPLHQQPAQLQSIVQSRHLVINYGPFYNKYLQSYSEGDSSIDDLDQQYQGYNQLKIYFPKISEILEYFINPNEFILLQQPLANNQYITLPIINGLLSQSKLVYKSARAYYEENIYYKLIFQHLNDVRNAYAALAKFPVMRFRVFAMERRDKHCKEVYPCVIMRNIAQETTFQNLKIKLSQHLLNLNLIKWVKPFQLRQTFNTFLYFETYKQCQSVCLTLNNKSLFYPNQKIKCHIHPASRRGSIYDTNFQLYVNKQECNKIDVQFKQQS